MARAHRGFETLSRLKAKLEAEEERVRINNIICPAHPTIKGERCRVGENKRDERRLYFATRADPEPQEWRDVGPCPKNIEKKVLALGRSVVFHRGPPGVMLFFHPDDD